MKFNQAFTLAAAKPVNPKRIEDVRPLVALYLLPSITRLQMPELVNAVVVLFLLGVRTGRYMEKL